MLHDQKVSNFLWGEVTNTMVSIQNKNPHQALGEKTPNEVFRGIKPDVGHLINSCAKGQEEQAGSH